MSEIGAGSGSSFPGTLDTDNTLEVNSPNAGKTKARAECINDLGACVVAIETELGTDPAGSKTDVKTFLQTEHDADGTHGNITTGTIASGAITATAGTALTSVSTSNDGTAAAHLTLKPADYGAGKPRMDIKQTTTSGQFEITGWDGSDSDQFKFLITAPAGLTLSSTTGLTLSGPVSVGANQITSTVTTGTAPLVVASTTEVANLKAASAGNADTVDNKNPGDASGIATLDANTRVVEPANSLHDGTNDINMKIINIGDWNMDATLNVDVAHGLTAANIRSVSALVVNDSGTNKYPLTLGTPGAADTEFDGWVAYVNATNIGLARLAGGAYDNTNFDSTSYNRGWITVIYVS